MEHAEVATIIVEVRGKYFDLDIVDTFVAMQNEFVEIAEKYSDVVESIGTQQQAA